MAGEASYMVKVRAKDTHHLAELLQSDIGIIKGIIQTESNITLQILKNSSKLPLESKK